MKINNKMKKQSGFTLIELALVIAGLAIISFGAFVVSGGVLDNARISSMTNQIQSVKTATELFKLHTGCQVIDLRALIVDDNDHSSCTSAHSGWEGPYIQNANISTTDGIFRLDNLASGVQLEIVVGSGTEQVIQSTTIGDIGQGVIDNLCPGAAAAGIADATATSATVPCGFDDSDVTDKNVQYFWLGN